MAWSSTALRSAEYWPDSSYLVSWSLYKPRLTGLQSRSFGLLAVCANAIEPQPMVIANAVETKKRPFIFPLKILARVPVRPRGFAHTSKGALLLAVLDRLGDERRTREIAIPQPVQALCEPPPMALNSLA